MNFKTLSLLLPLSLLACASSSSEQGTILLAVKNAQEATLSFRAPVPDILKVETFRVVVSGDDFQPIEASFPGNSTSGVLSGIPLGDNRTVLIEAINKKGQVVRRNQITGIKIQGGDPTPIEATLFSVPVATTPAEGSLITQTRLIFKGYAEPGGSLEIEDNLKDSPSSLLLDLNTSDNLVSPSLSDGSFTFQPPFLPTGVHTFIIRDPESGEESQITVTLVQAGLEPGTGMIGNLGKFPEVVEAMVNDKVR